MKRYPKYKDSGVPWLGQVPLNWGVMRCKHYLRERSQRSIDGSETLLSVSEYFGVKPRSEAIGEGEILVRAKSLVDYKVCKVGDLVMNIMLAWKKAYGVTKYEGIVSPAYAVFKFTGNEVIPDYLHYLLRTDTYAGEFKRNSSGVIDSRLRLYPEEFFRIPFIVPSINEQLCIVGFLNDAISKMDSAIEAQERMIELLKERRSAIITQAVTKGLNPNAKMKDSGVPWLGQVPAHWTLLRFKNLFVELDARKNPQLPVGSISYGKVVYKDDQDIHEPTKESYQAVLKDEFLINPINLNYDLKSLRTALSEINVCVSPAYIVLSAAGNESLQYLRNLLYAFDLFHMKTLGSGVRHTITFNDIGSCVAVLPPIPEQERIADFLGAQLSQTDSAIEAQERMIELLKERRSAIITQAVTGQIDVR